MEIVGIATGVPSNTNATATSWPTGYTPRAGDRSYVLSQGKYDGLSMFTVADGGIGWAQTSVTSGGIAGTGNDVGPVTSVIFCRTLLANESASPVISMGVIKYVSWTWVHLIVRPTAGGSFRDAANVGTPFATTADTNTASPLSGTATPVNFCTAGDLIYMQGLIPTDSGSALDATTATPTATGLSGGLVLKATTQYLESSLGADFAMGYMTWQGFTGTATAGIPLSFVFTGATNHSGIVQMVGLRQVIPAVTQAAYRFYADGTESASTALGTQSTAYSATVSGTLNLGARVRLQATTAVAVDSLMSWQLQWEKNASGVWHNVVAGTGGTGGDSYSETNGDADGFFTETLHGHGQSFMGDGREIESASFQIKRSGSIAIGTTLEARLYAHTGTFGTTGAGTGAALATSVTKYDGALLSTSTYSWLDFVFPPGTTLTNGTPYVIVLYCSGGISTPSTQSPVVLVDNTSPTHAGNRCTMSNTGTFGGFSTQDMVFKVTTNGGGAVVPFDSTNLTAAEVTTNRLGAGTGSFVAGEVSETGTVNSHGWTASNYTELLFSITLQATDLATSDVLRFRVLKNGAPTHMTHTSVPTINLSSVTGGGGAVSRPRNIRVGNQAHVQSHSW